jgi:hypothetical protein
MRAWLRVAWVLALAPGACGDQQAPPANPSLVPSNQPVCCKEVERPAGMLNAVCCADGEWRYDTATGGQDECTPYGGPGDICPPSEPRR